MRDRPVRILALALLVIMVVAVVAALRKAPLEALTDWLVRFAKRFALAAALSLGVFALFRFLLLRLGLALLATPLAVTAALLAFATSGGYNAVAGAVGLPKVKGAAYSDVCAELDNWTFEEVAGRTVGICVNWPRAVA